MPIIESAKKRAKQSEVRKARLRPFKTRMLTLFKNMFKWASEGNAEKMQTQLSDTYKAIDMAAKKNIIHKNNAARKKSAVQSALSKVLKASPEKKVETPAKKPTAPKAPAKKAVAAKAPAKKAPAKKAPAKKATK